MALLPGEQRRENCNKEKKPTRLLRERVSDARNTFTNWPWKSNLARVAQQLGERRGPSASSSMTAPTSTFWSVPIACSFSRIYHTTLLGMPHCNDLCDSDHQSNSSSQESIMCHLLKLFWVVVFHQEFHSLVYVAPDAPNDHLRMLRL